uniref:Uncharacterized protein n=1 Tax=Romanomermis culicivorax TaxID=13658 RepID=A0A915HK11_ROMCU
MKCTIIICTVILCILHLSDAGRKKSRPEKSPPRVESWENDGEESSSDDDFSAELKDLFNKGRRRAHRYWQRWNKKFGGDDDDQNDDDRYLGKNRRYGGRRILKKWKSGDGDENDDDDRRSGKSRQYGGRRIMKGGRKFLRGLQDKFSSFGKQISGQGVKDQCPAWSDWEESECLWPGKGSPNLPEACHVTNFTNALPEPIVQYYTSKGAEILDNIQRVFNQRGLTQPCGRCSPKVACRQRQYVHKESQCMPVEFAFVNQNDDCDSKKVCEISAVNGNCPAPLPQENFVKYNSMVAKHYGLSATQGPFNFDGTRLGVSMGSRAEDLGSSLKRFLQDIDRKFKSLDDDQSEDQDDIQIGDQPGDVPEGDDQTSPYSYEIPLWHCIKDSSGEKCLCCCGDYFPDIATGQCIRIENGNRYPPLDFGYSSS